MAALQPGTERMTSPGASVVPAGPLAGHGVLVLGRDGPLAAAIAEACARAGAWVMVQLALGDLRSRQRLGFLGLSGLAIRIAATPLGPSDDCTAAIEEASAWQHGPDILVTTSALAAKPSPVLRLDAEGPSWHQTWESVIAANLLQPLAAVHDATAALLAAAPGPGQAPALTRIVCVAPPLPIAGQRDHDASLAQQSTRLLVEGLARQFAPYQVRVNGILPGLLGPSREAGAEALSPPRLADLIETIPEGRLATPADIAQAVVWLASDAAQYLTGVMLRVDGGLNIGSA